MRCWKCFTSIMPLKVIVQSVAITLAQLCLATSVIANSVEGTADEDIPAGIFDLSIEELLNISIVTVSKRPERILDAPGIVNIVTAADIKRYGANTLFEVLGRLPSVYAYSYPSLRENVISFRGQSEGADNHMLLLINGRPLREGYTGGINGHVYRSFPLEVIDQIEVVRGPGSVLYGTNALSGVVNIITRKPESDLTGEASVSGGSFGTWQANVTTGFEKKDLQILGGLKLLKTDGWKSRGIDASGMYGADRHEDDSYGAMLHLGYKNFTFDASISDSDSEEFDVALTWPLQRYTKRSRFADAGYIHEINQDWKLSLNATYNGYDQNYVNRLITANEDDLLYEATIDGRIADSMNVLAGFSYKSVDGTFTSFGIQCKKIPLVGLTASQKGISFSNVSFGSSNPEVGP